MLAIHLDQKERLMKDIRERPMQMHRDTEAARDSQGRKEPPQAPTCRDLKGYNYWKKCELYTNVQLVRAPPYNKTVIDNPKNNETECDRHKHENASTTVGCSTLPTTLPQCKRSGIEGTF